MAKTADVKSKRVILHFDYDCFYASCHEKLNPALKELPLAIQQKQIIVTCNYVARKSGLHKLQLLSEAKKACPELVVVNGENLDIFRDFSKENFLFLKQYIWSNKIERLGFDEVFMDVTDQIDFNLALAEREGFKSGFYQLKPDQPNYGFKFEWDVLPGNLHPPLTGENSRLPKDIQDQIPKRLLLAAHLAQYLRLSLLGEQGFTCSAGVCISKLTAKLAGTIHKPCAQTLLLPDFLQEYLDDLEILKIPGIGGKTGRMMRDHIREYKRIEDARDQPSIKGNFQLPEDGTETFDLDDNTEKDGLAKAESDRIDQAVKDDFMMAYYNDYDVKTKVLEARTVLNRQRLDAALGNMPPGAGRIWELLHGIDHTEVAKASLVPTQVSIEDTFRAGLITQDTPMNELENILSRLSITLIRRLKTDLLTAGDPPMDDYAAIDITQLDQPSKKWQAFPKTLRISTRDRNTRSYGKRESRSGPMPNFIFSLTTKLEETAKRLAKEALIPLFRRLHGPDVPGGTKYDLALINIAATNMSGGETGTEGGDVAAMFKRYTEVFPEGDWEKKRRFDETQEIQSLIPEILPDGEYIESEETVEVLDEDVEEGFLSDDDDFSDGVSADGESQGVVCKTCHVRLPLFAIGAHERFHKNMDDE